MGNNESRFVRPMDFAVGNPDKPHKVTLHESPGLLVGTNSLMPGQEQPLHDHPVQDKFYEVLAGKGWFTVGEDSRECGPGELILCPAGIPHGVENRGDELLTFLTVIAPWK